MQEKGRSISWSQDASEMGPTLPTAPFSMSPVRRKGGKTTESKERLVQCEKKNIRVPAICVELGILLHQVLKIKETIYIHCYFQPPVL